MAYKNGFKELAEIHNPDFQVKLFCHTISPEEMLKTFHGQISDINLQDYVAEEVRREFDKAKNVLLYSFFSYTMSSLAITHAYSCVEKAIITKSEKLGLVHHDYQNRHKIKDKIFSGAGLSVKINFALDRKWIGKKHFLYFENEEESIDPKLFKQHLEFWIGFRNSLSHEPSFLDILWRVPEQLQIFANLINALSSSDQAINSEIPSIALPKRPKPQQSVLMYIAQRQTGMLTFKPLP